MSAWPFPDPENAAAITVRQIVDGSKPVLHVCRDAEDGSWMFLTGGAFEMADSKMVSLRSIVDRDPTLTELADLPAGWQALRAAKGAPWQRSQSDADDA
jgi:hypothetical protein